MRKLLAILLSILIIGTVFVGCTQKSPPVDEQPANQDNQDVETETQDQDQEVPAEDEDETDEVVEAVSYTHLFLRCTGWIVSTYPLRYPCRFDTKP